MIHPETQLSHADPTTHTQLESTTELPPNLGLMTHHCPHTHGQPRSSQRNTNKSIANPYPHLPAHAFWTANAVIDPTTGASLKYAQLKLDTNSKAWIKAATDEIG
jgi:hypothetical protein